MLWIFLFMKRYVLTIGLIITLFISGCVFDRKNIDEVMKEVVENIEEKESEILIYDEINLEEVMNTSTWKVYENDNFNLKYPSNWNIEFDKNVGGILFSEKKSIMKYDVFINIYESLNSVPYMIELETNKVEENFEQKNINIKDIEYLGNKHIKFKEYNSHFDEFQFVDYYICNNVISFTYFLDEYRDNVDKLIKNIYCE